ncbi:MAG: CrcB family protein [Acidimicrobiia bacterium]
MIAFAIAGAGALGAPARYLVERALSRRFGHAFPWGTTAVNLVGSLLLGLLVGMVEFHHWRDDIVRVAGVGFVGAFTTFSTFAVESTRLPTRARLRYVGISVVGGLGLAAAGLALASI